MTVLINIGKWILAWLLEKLVAGVTSWVKEAQQKRAREQAVKEALKPYLASKTPEEQEHAFQDLLSHMRDN